MIIAPFVLAVGLLCAPPELKRAMWMWHGQPVLRSAEARRSFLAFIQAPKGDPDHRISVVFLGEVDPSDSGSVPAIGNLLDECHKDGVRVDFLCGEDSFAEPQGNGKGVSFVDQVLKYNASQPPNRQFDGFQLNVEPYALPNWPSPTLRSGFLKLYDLSKAEIRKASSHLLLGAAIPRWFDASELGGLHRDIIDRVDYVAVMDYVDTPASFVKDPANIVAYADQAGKQAWLGAEATELAKEPTATFYAKGAAAMEQAFDAARQAYGSSQGFAGVAIEYYETYIALRP